MPTPGKLFVNPNIDWEILLLCIFLQQLLESVFSAARVISNIRSFEQQMRKALPRLGALTPSHKSDIIPEWDLWAGRRYSWVTVLTSGTRFQPLSPLSRAHHTPCLAYLSVGHLCILPIFATFKSSTWSSGSQPHSLMPHLKITFFTALACLLTYSDNPLIISWIFCVSF